MNLSHCKGSTWSVSKLSHPLAFWLAAVHQVATWSLNSFSGGPYHRCTVPFCVAGSFLPLLCVDFSWRFNISCRISFVQAHWVVFARTPVCLGMLCSILGGNWADCKAPLLEESIETWALFGIARPKLTRARPLPGPRHALSEVHTILAIKYAYTMMTPCHSILYCTVDGRNPAATGIYKIL